MPKKEKLKFNLKKTTKRNHLIKVEQQLRKNQEHKESLFVTVGLGKYCITERQQQNLRWKRKLLRKKHTKNEERKERAIGGKNLDIMLVGQHWTG